MQKLKPQPSKPASSMAPGEIRIDGKNVFINGGPVLLSAVRPVPYTPRTTPTQHPLPKKHTKGAFKRPPPAPAGRRGKQIPVPYIKQAKSGYCGRASQAMVVQYWTDKNIGQQGLSPDTINAAIKHSKGTAFADAHHYVGANLSGSDPNALNAVTKSVLQGNPAIVYTNYYTHPGHIFVLTGYDPDVNPEQGEQFYINDTFPHYDKYGNPTDPTNVTYTKKDVPITMQSLLEHLHSQSANRNVIYIPPK